MSDEAERDRLQLIERIKERRSRNSAETTGQSSASEAIGEPYRAARDLKGLSAHQLEEAIALTLTTLLDSAHVVHVQKMGFTQDGEIALELSISPKHRSLLRG